VTPEMLAWENGKGATTEALRERLVNKNLDLRERGAVGVEGVIRNRVARLHWKVSNSRSTNALDTFKAHSHSDLLHIHTHICMLASGDSNTRRQPFTR
jgi:hypothetical protein